MKGNGKCWWKYCTFAQLLGNPLEFYDFFFLSVCVCACVVGKMRQFRVSIYAIEVIDSVMHEVWKFECRMQNIRFVFVSFSTFIRPIKSILPLNMPLASAIFFFEQFFSSHKKLFLVRFSESLYDQILF